MIKTTTVSSHYFSKSNLTPWISFIVLFCLIVMSTSSKGEPALMLPLHEIQYEELPPSWLLTPEPATAAAKQAPVDQVTTKVKKVKKVKKVAKVKKVTKVKKVANVKKIPPVDKAIQRIKPAVKQPIQPPKQVTVATTKVIASHLVPVKTLTTTATQGNAEAQYGLGMRYQYGNGVPKSRHKAHHWLSQSANAGHARAQFALSMFYQRYARSRKGIKRSLLLLKKAADQGLPDAQYNLGMMFKNGTLVHANAAESKKWLQLAASQGHELAQLTIR